MNQEVQNIINSYRKISYYLFNLGVILIPFLIAIFVSLWYANDDETSWSKNKDITQSYKNIQWVYYWNPLYSSINWQKISSWVNVLFIKDFFDSKNFRAQNSLIEKDSIVLPNSFWLWDADFFSSLSGVSQMQKVSLYMEALKNPITNVRLNEYKNQIWSVKTPRTLWGKKLFDVYWLKCLDQIKVTDYFCQQSVQKFINQIPLIDITQDRDWIKKIINKVNAEKKELICNAIYSFTQNSFKTVDMQYLLWCRSDFQVKYQNLANFILANSQIEKWFSKVIWDWEDENMKDLINNYMLVSYMQKAISSKYSEFQVWNYINNVSKLIQDKRLKPWFYADLVNYFNNQILAVEIEKLQKDWSSTEWINKRKEDINDINNWRWINMTPLTQLSSLNFSGSVREINTGWPIIIALSEKLENSLRSINNFEYKNGSLKKVSWQENSYSYEWTYDFNWEKFSFTWYLIYKNNSIFITSIKSNKTKVDEDTNYKLSNPVILSQLENIIKKSYDIYWNVLSFCDSLDKDINVKSCSDSRLILELEWENIIVLFNWNSIDSIKTTNPDFQSQLSLINTAVLSKKNFSSVVYPNINTSYHKYKSTNQNKNDTIKSNDPTISVSELNKIASLFKDYLPKGVTVVKKLSDWNSYTIEFEANWMKLRWVFNPILNNKLDNIYSLATNPARKIYWLEFFIIPWEADTFWQFIKDPWTLIKQVDLDFYNNYKDK